MKRLLLAAVLSVLWTALAFGQATQKQVFECAGAPAAPGAGRVAAYCDQTDGRLKVREGVGAVRNLSPTTAEIQGTITGAAPISVTAGVVSCPTCGTFHDPVTIAGQNYVSLVGQALTFNLVKAVHLDSQSATNLQALFANGTGGAAFRAIADGDIPAVIARDAEVSSAVAAHEAAGDPHVQYQRESEKDQASGYAGLSAAGLVATGQLGSGTANATNYLRGDRTWAPAGGGGGCPTCAANDVPVWNGTAFVPSLLDSDGTNTIQASGLLNLPAAAAIGPDPADSGAVRLSNGTAICWESSPAGVDVCSFFVNSAEGLQLGLSGTTEILFSVNNADQWYMTSNGFVPILNNTDDLGTPAENIKNIHLAGLVSFEGATLDANEYSLIADDPSVDANISAVRQFSATYDPVSLAANTTRTDMVTVTGVVSGRHVTAYAGDDPIGAAGACVVANVRASAANTVSVTLRNVVDITTACDLASSIWTFAQAAGGA